MSWYKTKQKFTVTETAYINMLQKGFNVQNQLKEWIPYDMTDYQKEYHAASINIKMDKAEDILFIKARGISFTWSTLIDLIMSCATFQSMNVPVIAQRENMALKHIKVAQQIIKNCNITELKNKVKFTRSTIEFLETGSIIEGYPSSSAADSVRGLRLLTCLVDEYAFQDSAQELLAAIQETMQGSMGQLKIGSTPCGRDNKFFEIIDAINSGTDMGFKLFKLPVFDPTKFNSNIDPEKQGLDPIAPWISIPMLSKKWKRGREIFLQENMCDFLDDSMALIKYTTIMKSINDKLKNHKDEFYRNSEYVYNTKNPIYVGVDVAEASDYVGVVAVEEITTSDKRVYYVERWLDYFNNVELPELEKYLDNLFYVYPTMVKMRIDRTGVGASMPSYLKKNWGGKVEGIHFSQTVNVEDGKRSEGINKIMSTNLKRMFEDNQMIILNDSMQTKHLGSVGWDFKGKSNKDGHSDIFFAYALAVLKSKYSIGRPTVNMVREKQQVVIENPTILDRMKGYGKSKQKHYII